MEIFFQTVFCCKIINNRVNRSVVRVQNFHFFYVQFYLLSNVLGKNLFRYKERFSFISVIYIFSFIVFMILTVYFAQR